MSLREERDTQTVYTDSLLNRELHPVPRSHWQSTKQSKQITHKPPKKWSWTLQETHFLWHNTHQECCSWQPQEHTTLLGNNTRIYKMFRTNYTCLQNNLKSIQMQSYSTLSWENPKVDVNVQNLKAIFRNWKTQICFSCLL